MTAQGKDGLCLCIKMFQEQQALLKTHMLQMDWVAIGELPLL